MSKLNQAAYDDGLAAYRAGENMAFVVGRAEIREQEYPNDEDGAPSLLCGFFDGFPRRL
jgi:hypothetical protein